MEDEAMEGIVESGEMDGYAETDEQEIGQWR